MNAQPALPAEDLIFLDESGIDTAMTRRYARARGGARALGDASAGHWRRLTLLGALGAEGLVAMMSVARATDTEVFLAVLEQVLLPALKERPHPIVVLDRLASHRSPRVRAAFEAAGVEVRFLRRPIPPTSTPSSRAGRRSRRPCAPPPRGPWKPWELCGNLGDDGLKRAAYRGG